MICPINTIIYITTFIHQKHNNNFQLVRITIYRLLTGRVSSPRLDTIHVSVSTELLYMYVEHILVLHVHMTHLLYFFPCIFRNRPVYWGGAGLLPDRGSTGCRRSRARRAGVRVRQVPGSLGGRLRWRRPSDVILGETHSSERFSRTR